jgi:hypothetical protein
VGKYYYLMSLFPPLPLELGETLHADLGWIADKAMLNVSPKDRDLLQAYLLSTDVINFINRESGRSRFIPGGLLALKNIVERRDLPEVIRDFLREPEMQRQYAYDLLWEMYVNGTLQLAEKQNSHFLKNYLPWEIQLRNSLSVLRAAACGLEPAGFLVTPSIANYNFDDFISGLKECPGPLESELFIDRERLKFIATCLDYDAFSLDALLGYIAGARIHRRWQNLKKPYELNTITFSGGTK